MSAPSPTPNMAPPHATNSSKRPRVSTATGVGAGTTTTGRTKRRKADTGASASGVSGTGAGVDDRGREDDGESGIGGEVRTKIDFNELPVETLYRYLEYHDLLPRWDVSPWSEEPCTPPNQLYTLPPPPPPQPIPAYENENPQASLSAPTQSQSLGGDVNMESEVEKNLASTEESAPVLANGTGITAHPDPASLTVDSEAHVDADANVNGDVDVDGKEEDEQPLEPERPTTRSKTHSLPTRRGHSPTPQPQPTQPLPTVKRGVTTLSDVHAAREVLAEKANAHWMKGLGGGQNKESETIVNFLYKMKVGPGRLLRVYNPAPPAFPGW